jgi:hypothetical protein
MLVDDLKGQPVTKLELVSAQPPELKVLEQFARDTAISSAAQGLLDAIEAAAAADPVTVVNTVTSLITST